VAPLVELDQVWKRYRLGGRGGLWPSRRPRDAELWALRDVSMHLEAGESVGLIGHNGAGKTTALKLLAGITRPTRGQARTRGRVASLINLGAGFHPELTGRENVLLNGVILGLTRREVRRRFDEIVAFAELEAYLDTPVKRYSSGMYARLGFAVAAHVDPDVLLVDEVLSVGDVAFQEKSIRKMLSFRERGRAILFVSHNLSAVEMMCPRCVWLDHGEIRLAGPTPSVVQAYLESVDAALVASAGAPGIADHGEGAVVVEQAFVLDADGRPKTDFDYGDGCTIRLRCLSRQDQASLTCTLTVRGDYGPLFASSSQPLSVRRGPLSLQCRLRELPLLPGLYRVEVAFGLGMPETVAAFRVTTDLAAFGSDSPVGATKSRGGFLAVPYTWRLECADGVRELPGLHLPRVQANARSGAPIIAGTREEAHGRG
jgi:lipopolysaccharide transport system ATP-binding protein